MGPLIYICVPKLQNLVSKLQFNTSKQAKHGVMLGFYLSITHHRAQGK